MPGLGLELELEACSPALAALMRAVAVAIAVPTLAVARAGLLELKLALARPLLELMLAPEPVLAMPVPASPRPCMYPRLGRAHALPRVLALALALEVGGACVSDGWAGAGDEAAAMGRGGCATAHSR